MKIKKRLNESLIEETFIVNIPIKIKFKIDSIEDENYIQDYHDVLYDNIYDNLEYKEYKNIYDYIHGMQDKILEELNISFMDIHHPYINIEDFKNIPIMNGNVFFEVDIDEPVSKSKLSRIFNTLLNNNVVNQEFAIPIKNGEDTFNVSIEVNKISNIEIGEG